MRAKLEQKQKASDAKRGEALSAFFLFFPILSGSTHAHFLIASEIDLTSFVGVNDKSLEEQIRDAEAAAAALIMDEVRLDSLFSPLSF